MKFQNAQWLWGLIFLPCVLWMAVAVEKKKLLKLDLFIGKTLWERLIPNFDPHSRKRKYLLWTLGICFIVLALARPQWGSHEETSKVTGLDILVVLDVSTSMETEDAVPSRLKKAKHFIRSFADRLKGDRLGLIPFAGSAMLTCPLTTDVDYFLEAVQAASPKLIFNQGTDIAVGLETARKAIIRGAEESPDGNEVRRFQSQENPHPVHAVLLISDGEDHEKLASEQARKLRELGIRFYVLGVGSEKGSPIPLRDEIGNLIGYKKDKSGKSILSTFQPQALSRLAADGGGKYWNLSPEESEIDEILADMGTLQRTDYEERRYLVYEDRFQFFLLIAFLFFIAELSLSLQRKTPGGSEVGLLAVIFSLYLNGFVVLAQDDGPFASASPISKEKWIPPSYDIYLKNKKGIDAYEGGNFDEAQKQFSAAQIENPNLPELHYNQGLNQHQKGDSEAAGFEFYEAARGAAKRGDTKLEGESLFNLGVNQAKQGDVSGAIQSYLEAIASAKKTKDLALENDARKNLELIPMQMQQQQQGQGQGQEQEDQKQEPQQQSKSPKKYRAPELDRKKQYQSKNLSKEDADRVMEELKSRERELQSKLKKNHERSQPRNQNNTKDW